MSLFNSASKGLKFDQPGTSHTGTVKSAPRERQQTKFGSQEPDFWPNGDPKMQILVDLQTSLRDDANDDGDRTLYVASGNMKRAISDAIRQSGAADLAPGGVLTVTYVGNDPSSKNPANPAKMYAAQYTPGATAFATPANVPGVPTPQPPQPPAFVPTTATTRPPAQAAQQAVNAAGLTVDQQQKVAQLRAAGIDDNTIATAVGVTVDQIAATPF